MAGVNTPHTIGAARAAALVLAQALSIELDFRSFYDSCDTTDEVVAGCMDTQSPTGQMLHCRRWRLSGRQPNINVPSLREIDNCVQHSVNKIGYTRSPEEYNEQKILNDGQFRIIFFQC